MTTIPKKDPSTDSWHKILLKRKIRTGETADLPNDYISINPTDYSGYIITVFRNNGDVVSKFSKNILTGYSTVEEVSEDSKTKIKIKMLGSVTKGMFNETFYYKVFVQLSGVTTGSMLDGKTKGTPIFETGESQLTTLPGTF